jgi:astacin
VPICHCASLTAAALHVFLALQTPPAMAQFQDHRADVPNTVETPPQGPGIPRAEQVPAPSGSDVKSAMVRLPGHAEKGRIRYVQVGGDAVIEGDINLGKVDRLEWLGAKGRFQSIRPGQPGIVRQPLTTTADIAHLWPGGIVPYDASVPAEIQAAVNDALAIISATNIRLVPKNNESAYIQFVVDKTLKGAGESPVGRQGSVQTIKLIPNASSTTVVHELLHSFGVWHEQSRTDRDSFVEILWPNIMSGQEHNFDRHDDSATSTAYDFRSIMHYGSQAFGRIDPSTGTELRTIRSRDPGRAIAPSSTLSAMDIAGLNQIYPPNDCGQVPVLFEDVDRAGRRVPIYRDVTDLHGPLAFGDKVSSLCIPFGWSVALFEDVNFAGHSTILSGPMTIENLHSPSQRFGGDKLSSIRVVGVMANVPPAVCQDAVSLFQHAGFEGRNLILNASAANLHTLNLGDEVSSVCVPAGVTLELFEHVDFGGGAIRIDGPFAINDLALSSPDQVHWGDKFSSARLNGIVTNPLPASCGNNPVAFEHDNFRGTQIALGTSAINLHLLALGDRISSLCIPAGWKITIHEDVDFGGRSAVLTGAVSHQDLSAPIADFTWQDRISSIHVDPPAGAPSVPCTSPVLYHFDGLRGGTFSVTRNHPSLHGYGWGDRASSACVPAGWQVAIFADAQFLGAQSTLVGPVVVEDLRTGAPGGNWNKRISSVKINARPGGAAPRLPCTMPALYVDHHYAGRRKSYPAGTVADNLHTDGNGDTFSSVCVPAGFTLKVFEHINQGGRSLTLVGPVEILDLKRDRPSGEDWGDRISSLSVN